MTGKPGPLYRGILQRARTTGKVRLIVALAFVLAHGPMSAQGVERLGFALAISNDSLGDWHDRWRSSSLEVGVLTGPSASMTGGLLEYRFRADVLMPANIGTVVPADRRHAGVLAFGLHGHSDIGAVDVRVGGDLVMVGPQTGLYRFQTKLHDIFGFITPNLPEFQIGNSVRFDVSAEAGSSLCSGNWAIRPFVEVRTGTEDIVRAGIDLSSSTGACRDDLVMRTVATGHLVPYGFEHGIGLRFVAGADVAWVRESLYLPENHGYELTPVRLRIRGGVHRTGRRFDVFYGLTWLGEEFKAQPEGQFVGTLQVKLRF